ncbi:MAG: sortase [bacterium]
MTRAEARTVITEALQRAYKRLRTPYGAALIAVSILCLLYPLFPELQFRLQRASVDHPGLARILPPSLRAPDTSTVPKTGNWLVIPAIGVREEILEGPDLSVLNKKEGVWHQVGDISHNLVLAGHRFQYLPPNAHTFYNLNRLETGDIIIIYWNATAQVYVVKITETVDSDQVSILNQNFSNQLTLYTCDSWAMTRRLVVIATKK